ncbi:MAG: DUF6582 domain-containing protein [Terriglobales bacterium]
MATRTKRRPSTGQRTLAVKDREKLPEAAFAFPKQRKEPLTNAAHVRNALARFNQVEGVSDAERDRAFIKVKKAAQRLGVDVQEANWRELGKQPHTVSSKKPRPAALGDGAPSQRRLRSAARKSRSR